MTWRVIGEELRASAASRPGHVAVIRDERSLTYAELHRRAEAAARGLREVGVQRGDRVALVCPNDLDMAVAVYGVALAGGCFCPINPSVKHDRLAYMLADTQAAAVVCDPELLEKVAGVAEETGAGPAGTVASFERGASGGREAGGGEPQAGDGAEPEPGGHILDVDLASIIYTSGTTGEPKGVTLTHRNMTFVGESIIESLQMNSEDRVLCVLPLSFGYGLFQLLMCVRLGATLVMEPGFAFAGKVVEILERERITILPGVPSVFAVLTSLQGLAERDLPHLRLLTNAGAGLPEAMRAELRGTFPGAGLHSMYGLTECLRVSTLPPEEQDRKPGSVGKPIPGTDAWVADEEGQPLPPGEVGELLVRGGHVMQGYWRDLEATGLKLRPGHWPWERILATGDLFRADEEGYLYVEGRRDDQIKSRGEKVMPREVEDALLSHEAVHEAAVVGVPDRLLGQAICAHVVLAAGADAKPPELRRHCAERLEVHKVPKQVVIRDALPRTINGKLDRKALAAEAG